MREDKDAGISKVDARKVSVILSGREIEVSHVKSSSFRTIEVGPALLKLVGNATHTTNSAQVRFFYFG